MKEKGNIFGGMVLLMGAVALIANRLGFLEGVGFWTILLNICLLSILIQGIFRRKVGTTLFSAAILLFVFDELLHMETILEGIGFWTILFNICLLTILIKGIFQRQIGTILFSAAFLIIINDKLLHLESITPWPVLGAALLGTIGLKSLFPGWGHDHRECDDNSYPLGIEDGTCDGADAGDWDEDQENSRQEVCDQDGKYVSYDVIFNQSTKYLFGVISRVDIDIIFGSTQIYFTEALLQRGRADVDVDCYFGNVTLYVPSSWTVELDTENIFAHAEQRGRGSRSGVNVLRVDGDVIFGKLEVIQI